MFEYFHLYICTTCRYCQDAIDLLEKENQEFIVTVMDKSPQFRKGIATHLNFPTVPLIVRGTLEGEVVMVGGYTQLKEYLENTDTEDAKDD